jgi:predicted neuraminidase
MTAVPCGLLYQSMEGCISLSKKDIASGEGSYAYPTALQTPDGLIHVMFTSDDRTTIRMATFDESYLTEVP